MSDSGKVDVEGVLSSVRQLVTDKNFAKPSDDNAVSGEGNQDVGAALLLTSALRIDGEDEIDAAAAGSEIPNADGADIQGLRNMLRGASVKNAEPKDDVEPPQKPSLRSRLHLSVSSQEEDANSGGEEYEDQGALGQDAFAPSEDDSSAVMMNVVSAVANSDPVVTPDPVVEDSVAENTAVAAETPAEPTPDVPLEESYNPDIIIDTDADSTDQIEASSEAAEITEGLDSGAEQPQSEPVSEPVSEASDNALADDMSESGASEEDPVLEVSFGEQPPLETPEDVPAPSEVSTEEEPVLEVSYNEETEDADVSTILSDADFSDDTAYDFSGLSDDKQDAQDSVHVLDAADKVADEASENMPAGVDAIAASLIREVDLTDLTPSAIDEDMLRDMVADVVRQELGGVMGERITRNVRKLVRREIHRALMSRDFE